MKRSQLSAEKRTVVGKKVKNLRKTGKLPANIYGSKIKSQSLQVSTEEFQKVYKETGTTGLIDLSVEGTKDAHPVLVHNVQTHPVTDVPLHADFHEVNLTEKMQAQIPVHFIGKSEAAEKKIGVLLQLIDTIEVEALPTDLPEEIAVDISSLAEVGDEITIASLKIDGNYTFIAPGKTVIAKINPLEKEELPEPVAAAPTEGEAAPAEGEEGKPAGEQPAAPAEGAKAPEKAQEQKK